MKSKIKQKIILGALFLIFVITEFSVYAFQDCSSFLKGFSSPRDQCSFSKTIPLFLFRNSDQKKIGIELEEAKLLIRDAARDTENGVKASSSVQNLIERMANKLEKNCPTPNPALSQLNQGAWELLYTTNKGNSAGIIGPYVGPLTFVGQVTQVVDLVEERYWNIVEVGPLRAELEATWKIKSKSNWTVIFKTIAFKLFGCQFYQKDFDTPATGDWSMTYLDSEFRILRASGREGVTNIYILSKTV